MASHEELLSGDKGDGQPEPPRVLDRAPDARQVRGWSSSAGGEPSGGAPPGGGAPSRDGPWGSAPRTAPHKARDDLRLSLHHPVEEKGRVCCDEDLEPSFTSVDENVNLWLEEELRLENEAALDYGVISAVTLLLTGISLVAVSYAVPRGVAVDRDSVSAREMERLETESARVGAHLDRCVIAGLCLLTLGGVVLSVLLMISMWKGEMYRRKALAYVKRTTKLYGSINLKTRQSPRHSSAHVSMEMEESLT